MACELLLLLLSYCFRSAECFFHGVHDSLCNTIVVGTWINVWLSVCSYFVTQYIVAVNEIWSCSNKPSSNMFLTEKNWLKFTGSRDDITCVMFGRTASMAHSDLPLVIN